MARAKPSQASQTLTDLADLAAASNVAEAEGPAVAQRDAFGRSYATGKRKNAIARVWIKPGTGKLTVNGRDVAVYFARPVLRMIINQPFQISERSDQFDVYCTVVGGGLSGQAGAVRHGIATALTLYERAQSHGGCSDSTAAIQRLRK